MAPEDKDYYRELLFEIRHLELTKSINRASAHVSGAILFTAIHN